MGVIVMTSPWSYLAAFQRYKSFCTPKAIFFSTPPLFGRKFRGVPLGLDPWCLGCKERTSRL